MNGDARDRAGDDRGDGAWLTYDQLAQIRHISRRAAVRMTQRHRLRRQPGNDGLVRVWVPHDMANPSQRASQRDDGGDDARASQRDGARDTTAFEVALAAIREAKDSEIATLRGVIDGLRASIGRVEERAARAEQGRDALRDRLTAMQEQLADAHAALQAAENADVRAGEAEAGRAEERGRADRAETATTAERGRADVLHERIEALQEQLTARQEVIDAAEATRRAEDERRARGRWARLRAAWRGE